MIAPGNLSGRASNWLGRVMKTASVLLMIAIWATRQGHSQSMPPATISTVQQSPEKQAVFQARFPAYMVRLLNQTELGAVPSLEIYRNEQMIFRLPLVSGLDSATATEHLSQIQYKVHAPVPGGPHAYYEIVATAASSIWKKREFHWRLYEDHLEFDQAAWGSGKLGNCYFFSNGLPGLWDKGRSDGGAWNSMLMADRYWSPTPNHANQWEYPIAEPRTIGFEVDALHGNEDDFRPEQMNLFSPPPFMLAFHLGGEWASVGVGAPPGQYRFPALQYSGSRYAGAAFWVAYLGYQEIGDRPGGEFHSPVAAIHFAYSALDTLEHYSGWLHQSGFATAPSYPDVPWHHLPVFCGWAEQTTRAVPYGQPANAESTQKNYEAWVAELERRNLPVGTIVIDDKWQKGYGSFDIDQQKWPDLKGFVASQHQHGRHVLLWVPVAQADGLPKDLCVNDEQGHCLAPHLGSPAYEAFLREKIRNLVETVGVDGFKEDWVWAPTTTGLPVPAEVAGIEGVRLFQKILYSETHRWKPDAMVETQTANAAFRDSSDVLRLNDIWYSTRDVVETMRERARIAHISGWGLVDTDNASSTTRSTWWQYMEAQPSIGIPSLYFLHRTESTLEEPADSDWVALAGIWQRYIATSVKLNRW
jgi:hypothetical protein